MSIRDCSRACLLLTFGLGACVSSAPPQGSAAASSETIARCPLGVPRTRIHVADHRGTIELSFVTSDGAFVSELRARVRSQAARHGPDEHAGLGHHGTWHRVGHGHGMRLWSMPPMRTEVVDVDGGARLGITPVDAEQEPELRRQIIARVARVEAAGCRE